MRISKITFVLLVTIIAFIIGQYSNNLAQNSKGNICGPTVNERLTKYFELNETKSTQIINNTENNHSWESRSELIMIGDRKVEWTDKVEKLKSESFIKIDGQAIPFNGIQSINEADENRKIQMEMVGEWRQVKLYKLYRQEILGITIGPRSCTGLMCGVAAQILYDVNTKKATFFGTFRSDEELRLFRFTNEEVFYFLAKRFDGDPHGEEEASVTYSAYQLKTNGDFELSKNAAGKPYFIKHTYYPDVFDTRSKKFTAATKADIFEQNWIEKID